MKKLIFSFAALAFATMSRADDLSLYYDPTEGDPTLLSAVENMDKIVFNNGVMTVIQKDGAQIATELSIVKRLYFSTPDVVGIDAPQTDTPTVPVTGVYDLTGRKMNVQSLSELPKGIYIVDGKKVNIK